MNDIGDLDICSSHEKFMDKTTVLYGESGTGKSVLIVDILYALKPYIDQCIVFSPTDRQNHTYDRGIVPVPFIHYNFTEKLLNDIWLRQEALVATYARSNDPRILHALYNKIPQHIRSDADKLLRNIDEKLRAYESTVPSDSSQIPKMREDCQELKIKVYKQIINANDDIISQMDLDPDLAYCHRYHNTNPRIVLIFDDCTDLIKKHRNSSVMQKLFYQGRHSKITALIACHTDKALEAELKKNAAVSIFTEKSCAIAYFMRQSTSLDKEAQMAATGVCRLVFDSGIPHQKLAWVRHEKKFYKFIATQRKNFRFCNDLLWEYAKASEAEAGRVSSNNPFMHIFK
jgi:hypothetical protein